MSRSKFRNRSRGIYAGISLIISGCLLNPQPDEPNNAMGGNDSSGGVASTSVDREEPDTEARGGGISTGWSSSVNYPAGMGGSTGAARDPSAAGSGTAGSAGIAAVGGGTLLATTSHAGAAGIEH